MRDKFKVISTDGYDDGYYWDYRIWFAYDGKEYTYMSEGSGSGYIECAEAIAKGVISLPKGYRDSRFSSDVVVDKKELIGYVKRLLASGENEISLLEDDEKNDYKDLEECASEHRQLAEWLKELKELKEWRENGEKQI